MERFRLSRSALQLLAELKHVSGSNETALIEQALMHYFAQVFGTEALRSKLGVPLPVVSQGKDILSETEPQEVLNWLTEAFSGEPTPVSPQTLVEPKPTQTIKRRRLELEMSRKELALQSGLTEETLLALEDGQSIWLGTREQWSLATALDWSLAQLQQALNLNPR